MKKRIQYLSQFSMNQVDSMYRNGQVTQTEFEAYCRVWEWSAVRWGGQADLKQEAFWKKYGKDRFYAKINKVRRAFNFEPIIP